MGKREWVRPPWGEWEWQDGGTAGRQIGGRRKEDEQWEKKKRESYGSCLRGSKEVKLGAEEERAKGQEAVRVAAAWARGKWKRAAGPRRRNSSESAGGRQARAALRAACPRAGGGMGDGWGYRGLRRTAGHAPPRSSAR